MRQNLKINMLKTFLFLSFIASSVISYAQYRPGTTISTPYGKVTTAGTYTPQTFYGNSDLIVNRKHKYTILLKDGTEYQEKSRINIDDKIHNITRKIDGKKIKITPSETNSIYRTDIKGKKIEGIPIDSCWVFLADSGRISTFSVTSDLDYPTLRYFKSDKDGKILALTKENLSSLFDDDPLLLELVKKNRLLKAIKDYNK